MLMAWWPEKSLSLEAMQVLLHFCCMEIFQSRSPSRVLPSNLLAWISRPWIISQSNFLYFCSDSQSGPINSICWEIFPCKIWLGNAEPLAGQNLCGFLKYAHNVPDTPLKMLYNYAILRTLWTHQNTERRKKNTLKNKMAVSGRCMNVGCSTLLLFLAVLSLFRSFKGF